MADQWKVRLPVTQHLDLARSVRSIQTVADETERAEQRQKTTRRDTTGRDTRTAAARRLGGLVLGLRRPGAIRPTRRRARRPGPGRAGRLISTRATWVLTVVSETHELGGGSRRSTCLAYSQRTSSCAR